MTKFTQASLFITTAAAWLIALAGHASAQGNAGVVVDAAGVLSVKTFADPTGALTRRRLMEAKAALDGDLARPSDMRKLSLTRLEAAVARSIERGEGIPDEMKNLAGLTKIQYVFFYPETKDIVIAGPAEGYFQDLSGRAVGIVSGQSILQLEDLVVALRAFGPDGRRTGQIGCSIDPTPEGLQRMQQFLARIGGRATPRDTQFIVNGLRESLGKQNVRVEGVSPETHFAQVMVEADYRMKLIGIGLERPEARIPSYVSKANPASIARNALLRWYFVPNYECVRVSEDEAAMELVGDGVKLVGADELVKDGGVRVASGAVDRAGLAFVHTFTEQYPHLARTSPVFGQLKNLIDMAITAAFIQDRDWYGRAGWNMRFFGDERAFPVAKHTAPKQVDSAVNAIWKGHTLMTPIGGGVEINARRALESEKMLDDEDGKLAESYEKLDLSKLPAEQWWWD